MSACKAFPVRPIARRGFSLTELLAIVGISAISIAVVAPSLAYSSSEIQQRADCQTNLKQLALAFLQYVQDTDEWCPLSGSSPTDPNAWAMALHSYLPNYNIYHCPSDPDPLSRLRDSKTYQGDPNFTDYWYNSRLSHAALSNLTHIPCTIFAGDGSGQPRSAGLNLGTAAYVYDGRNFPITTASPTGSDWQVRHLGGANYAFVDGHVKWVSLSVIAPTATSRPNGKVFTFMVS